MRLGVGRERPSRLVERHALPDAVQDVEHRLVLRRREEHPVGGAHGHPGLPRQFLDARDADLVVAVLVPPRREGQPFAEGQPQPQHGRFR